MKKPETINAAEKAPDSMLNFSGTPMEMGAEIWRRMCMPAVGEVSRELPPIDMVRLYAGFTMAAWGAMLADFGHTHAIDIARQMLARFEKDAPSLANGGMTATH